MVSRYENYNDLLNRGNTDTPMGEEDKFNLKRNLETLEAMDHVEILKIIHECMNKKVYTVSNRQTMLDLDDLSNECLWRMMYYVNFCLANQMREKEKMDAERKHLERLHELEENMKREKSNLKLSVLNLNMHINNKPSSSIVANSTDDSLMEKEEEEEEEDGMEMEPDSVVMPLSQPSTMNISYIEDDEVEDSDSISE